MTSSIKDFVDYNALHYPEKVWITSPETNTKITWSELKVFAASISREISKTELNKSKPIAIASHNSIGACLTFIGITYGGYLATPLNLISGTETLSYVIDHSQVKLIFLSPDNYYLIKNATEKCNSNIKTIEVDPSSGPIFKNHKEVAINKKEISSNPQDPALLMYTSGTTGVPKGVLLSHANLISAGRNVMIGHNLTTSDIAMCVLPIYHINGLCVTVFGTLVSASGLVMPYKFSLTTFWQHISKYNCTWFSAVPTLFSYLLNNKGAGQIKTGKLRFSRSASAPLSPDIHRSFEKRFNIPIIETMGLTETGAQILSNPMPPNIRKIGSPGLAVGNEIMIADENQKPLPNNTVGEILVKGANVMIGYLHQPKETSKAINSQGWLRTGDLGRLDSDGFVFVTGRIKELIIKGGENIAPREIDEALLRHPSILEAAAFSVPCKNYGQKPEAGIRLKDGKEISLGKLFEHCTKILGNFKTPSKIHILEDLPKGSSGKIQRQKLFSIIYPNKSDKADV
ncbi:MAG: AMP-binding protein [Rhodobacteraceae bacterium]|nr:AMP-binding protein [Paracoccaceae bacterium]